MKNLVQYLKAELYLFFKGFFSGSIMTILIPLVFSLFFSLSFRDAHEPEIQQDPISISVNNHDAGDIGQTFEDLVTSEEASNIFQIEESAEYEIDIPENFSDELEEAQVDILAGPGASQTTGNALATFVEDWQESLIKNSQLVEVAGENYPVYAAQLEDRLSSLDGHLFEANRFTSENTYTSNQYYSITGLIAVMFLFVFSLATLEVDERFEGLRKRLGIMPYSGFNKIIYESISLLLQVGISSGIYIAVWKIFDSETFTHNILFYLTWILLLGLLLVALIQALTVIFSVKLSFMLMSLIFNIYFLLVALPMEDMLDGPIAEWIGDNGLRRLTQDPFLHYVQTGNPTNHLGLAVILVIIALVLLFFSAGLNQYKEVKANA